MTDNFVQVNSATGKATNGTANQITAFGSVQNQSNTPIVVLVSTMSPPAMAAMTGTVTWVPNGMPAETQWQAVFTGTFTITTSYAVVAIASGEGVGGAQVSLTNTMLAEDC